MTGTFIVSLDCEGKWGMADAIGPQHDPITTAALIEAYGRVCQLFGQFDIKATFAFVSAFVLTDAERSRNEPALRDIDYRGKNWLVNYRRDSALGRGTGWHCPQALEIARAAGHEIASHGFCHVPFDDPLMSQFALKEEMNSIVKFAKSRSLEFRTFVYPRNAVAHSGLLQEAGVIGYREALPRSSRGASLLREMNIFDRAQDHGRIQDGMVRIPAGYLLNWRRGLRGAVPMSVSVQRWRSILRDATRNGRVAHMWFHPHNLITAPSTFELLRRVLHEVAEQRSGGRLVVQTQQAYCESRLVGWRGRLNASEKVMAGVDASNAPPIAPSTASASLERPQTGPRSA